MKYNYGDGVFLAGSVFFYLYYTGVGQSDNGVG